MMVQALAGHGEVKTFPETDHLMAEAADEIAEITRTWVAERFRRAHRPRSGRRLIAEHTARAQAAD